jgi:putative protein-disulfide isomerase
MVGRVVYLYDPLCGWCYGSGPAIRALAASGTVEIEALPTGLFAGDPQRRIDAAFARHVLEADARIERLSGEPFSEAYKRQVLGDADMPFDSALATRALNAVARWNPARELDALHALQRERYVHGRDLSDRAVIDAALAAALGDSAAQWRQRIDDDALPAFEAERAARARHWMRATAAHGVPTLALPAPDRTARALPGNWFFDATPLAQHLAELG